MVEIKTDAALDAMREAGRVVACALAAAREAAACGGVPARTGRSGPVSSGRGRVSSPFLGYRPSFAPVAFPAVICTSVNDAVSHGIPTGYRLRDGDLVSIDCGAQLDGWTGDAAITFTVGTPRPGDLDLIDATQQALDSRHCRRPGGQSHRRHLPRHRHRRPQGGLRHARRLRRPRHRPPHARRPPCPQPWSPRPRFPLRHGLVLAIEPMLMVGGQNTYRTDIDGWTLRTTDGSRAAHIEHTVAITDQGPRILTLP